MKRKIILAIIIIFTLLVSLAAGLQTIELVEANFLPLASVSYIYLPDNKTYNSNLLTLNVSVSYFVTSAEDRWIAYSIDGSENVTLTGTEYSIDLCWKGINITTPLPKLSEGSHRIDIYAQFSNPINFSTPDSRTVFFTIDTTTPTPAPSLTSTITHTQSPRDNQTIPSLTTTPKQPTPCPTLSTSSTNPPTQPLEIGQGGDDLTYKSLTILFGIIPMVSVTVIGVIVCFKKVKK